MHLVSERRQTVRIPSLDLRIQLQPDETIWTESSYKFTRASATGMLAGAGLRLRSLAHRSRTALRPGRRRPRARAPPPRPRLAPPDGTLREQFAVAA
jgi:hypothetical protein